MFATQESRGKLRAHVLRVNQHQTQVPWQTANGQQGVMLRCGRRDGDVFA